MDRTDYLAIWERLSLEEKAQWLQDPEYDEALERLFGAEVEGMRDLLLVRTRGGGEKKPVVLLPGGGGSELHSIRGIVTRLYLEPRVLLHGEGGYLKMDREGSADANPAVFATAMRCMPRAYDALRMFLNENAQLHEFPYDWRRHIEDSALQLHAAIERWSSRSPGIKFHLVCHSMGGLVARAYLALKPRAAEQRVEQVIMLGTPHHGVISKLMTLVHGDLSLRIMGKLNPANAPLETMRSMPGLFQLLPPPRDGWTLDAPYPVQGDWELYRAESWRIQGIEQSHLDAAKAFHSLLAGPTAQVPLVEIAGCNQKTAVAVTRSTPPGAQPEYDVTYMAQGANSGDGTVPLWSTLPPGGRRYFVSAKHGDLPRRSDVLQDVLRWIQGEPPELPDQVPEERGGWLALGTRAGLEPDVEDLDQVAEQEAARLRAQLENRTIDLQDLHLLQFGL
jgi:pimeloyl-ACP methyl ester carboxylesterase